MRRISVFAGLLLAAFMLGGCASDEVINKPAWPAMSPDEVVVHPSLQQLLASHHPLKVVLRVPNANNNVTQSQSGQVSGTENAVLNSAYDDIEKRLFEAGFVVRDRALLSTLIQNQGLTSYKDIQSRIDTDLIIDISSMSFNDPGNWLVTKQYTGDDGRVDIADDYAGGYYSMGQAVASVEAQFIIVSTGDVGGIVRLQVPLCRQVSCQYDYSNDGLGDISFNAMGNQSWAYNQNTETLTYLWSNGSGPGTFKQAADLIAQKLVQVLQGAQSSNSGGMSSQAGGGVIGVEAHDLTANIATQLGVPLGGGAQVVSVVPGSPAAAAGIHANDVIVRVDGQTVDGVADLKNKIAALKIGSSATLAIWRGQRQLKLVVQVASQS